MDRTDQNFLNSIGPIHSMPDTFAQRGNQTFGVESKSPERTKKHAFAFLGLAIATKGELSSFDTSDAAAVHEPKSVDKT